MTREEAINTLGNFKRYISGGGVTDRKANKAIDMAIESLTYQNLSKPNNTCEVDLISKADAIEVLCKSCRQWS